MKFLMLNDVIEGLNNKTGNTSHRFLEQNLNNSNYCLNFVICGDESLPEGERRCHVVMFCLQRFICDVHF